MPIGVRAGGARRIYIWNKQQCSCCLVQICFNQLPDCQWEECRNHWRTLHVLSIYGCVDFDIFRRKKKGPHKKPLVQLSIEEILPTILISKIYRTNLKFTNEHRNITSEYQNTLEGSPLVVIRVVTRATHNFHCPGVKGMCSLKNEYIRVADHSRFGVLCTFTCVVRKWGLGVEMFWKKFTPFQELDKRKVKLPDHKVHYMHLLMFFPKWYGPT